MGPFPWQTDGLILRSVGLVFRKNAEYFGAEAREILECCQQSLMGHSGEHLENQIASRNVDSGSLAHALSGATKNSIEWF